MNPLLVHPHNEWKIGLQQKLEISSAQTFNQQNGNHREMTIYLVSGYMRNNFRNKCVSEIDEICLMYFGFYYKYLIYIGVEICGVYHLEYLYDHQWFEQIQNNKIKIDVLLYPTLQIRPITQFIDDKYQIIYGFVLAPMFEMPWKGFLCINIISNEVHQIKINKDKNNNFHLLMSDVLQLNLPQNNNDNKWIRSKSSNFKQISYDNIWRDFENNLWNLFVSNRLYNENEKNIKNQQIWYIIHYLLLLYFDDLHTDYLNVPKLLLTPNEKPERYFTFYDDNYENEGFGFEITENCDKRIKDNNNYSDFEFDRDCYAKIIEYINGKILQCQCFFYVDWGGGYRSASGCNQHLYCAKFKIEKNLNKKINIKLDFDSVTKRVFITGEEYT